MARSPERSALLAAIRRHADAEENHRRVADACGRFDREFYDQLLPAVTRARLIADGARQAAPQAMVSRLLDDAPDGDEMPSAADAEAALAAAKAAVDAARAARPMLEEELRSAVNALEWAAVGLGNAVRDAVRADPATTRLLDEYDRAGRRLAQLGRALKSAGFNPPRIDAFSMRVVVSENDGLRGNAREHAFAADPAWAVALDRMRSDPDVELPGLPPEPDDDGERAAA